MDYDQPEQPKAHWGAKAAMALGKTAAATGAVFALGAILAPVGVFDAISNQIDSLTTAAATDPASTTNTVSNAAAAAVEPGLLDKAGQLLTDTREWVGQSQFASPTEAEFSRTALAGGGLLIGGKMMQTIADRHIENAMVPDLPPNGYAARVENGAMMGLMKARMQMASPGYMAQGPAIG